MSAETMTSDDVWVESPGDAAEFAARLERLRKRHRSMLAIAGLAVVLSFLLEVRPDQRVQFRFAPSLPLPGVCGSREIFGVECPGCGLTRAFIRMTRGDWDSAFALNRVSWLIGLAALLQFPYRLGALHELRHGRAPERRWPGWFGYGLVAALLGNWILRQLGI